MPILSLIAPPERLGPALVADIHSATDTAGEVVWLSKREAAEFPVEEPPADLAALRQSLADEMVDVNVIPDQPRRKRLLIADMDSTMIEQECIDELAAEAGVGERVAAITARAMNGDLDFEAALIERVGLLKGLPVALIDRVLSSRITLAAGGKALVATMKQHGARTALVSGGFLQFTEKVAKTMGFDETRANRLIEAGEKLTGEVARPILGRDAKVQALRDLIANASDAIAVGDGANDLGMIHAAGMGVALHAKPSVAGVAPYRIDNGDLTALLFLQGFRRDQFVAG